MNIIIFGCSKEIDLSEYTYIQGSFIYKYVISTNDYRVIVEHVYVKYPGLEKIIHEECIVEDKETFDLIPLDTYAWYNWELIKTQKGSIIVKKFK